MEANFKFPKLYNNYFCLLHRTIIISDGTIPEFNCRVKKTTEHSEIGCKKKNIN